ncbi:MAG: CRTAC1 family protein, partial [Chitinophagaceae bacterium]|nr:CRTAC1 family protein [Chitinophagaceae bacterium]
DYGITHSGFGFGGVFTDYDNDGDLDILVNHDFGYKNVPNKFYENNYPDEDFEEISEKIKMALPTNAMGTGVGDYNNDGFLDYYITNIKAGFLMTNHGPGKPLVNMTGTSGVKINKILDTSGGHTPVSWGANFADFDNDGDLDLFVSNGCLNPYIDANPDFFFENVNGLFVNKSKDVNLYNASIGRGSVVFDYDNDGDLDLLIVEQEPVESFPGAQGTLLFRNDSSKGNWIKIALYGVDQDKNGIGSRVEISVGKKKFIREIDGGSSHSSQNSVIAHFGLGTADHVDTIRVKWLGGKEQVIVNQKANQLIKITENNNGKKEVNRLWYLLLAIPVIIIAWFYFRAK